MEENRRAGRGEEEDGRRRRTGGGRRWREEDERAVEWRAGMTREGRGEQIARIGEKGVLRGTHA